MDRKERDEIVTLAVKALKRELTKNVISAETVATLTNTIQAFQSIRFSM